MKLEITRRDALKKAISVGVATAASGLAMSEAEAASDAQADHRLSVAISVNVVGQFFASTPTTIYMRLHISVAESDGNILCDSDADVVVEFRPNPNHANRAIIAAALAWLDEEFNIVLNHRDHVVLFGGAISC